jgi:hypothetical protein
LFTTTNGEHTDSVSVGVCVAPTIILLTNSSSIQRPAVFRRDQDFSIDSVIELNCTRASFTTIQWTITGCVSNCSSRMTFDPSVTTTTNLLDIPARTLSAGFYELKLTVTMDSLPNLTSSATTYVAIVPMGIRPNLVELGTLVISRGQQQNLLFNPGIHSRDFDGQSIHPSVSQLIYVHLS